MFEKTARQFEIEALSRCNYARAGKIWIRRRKRHDIHYVNDQKYNWAEEASLPVYTKITNPTIQES